LLREKGTQLLLLAWQQLHPPYQMAEMHQQGQQQGVQTCLDGSSFMSLTPLPGLLLHGCCAAMYIWLPCLLLEPISH
jgi:hypothetical protein